MKNKQKISGKRGSALLIAVVTISFLLVIGLAVSAMALSTLKMNVADSTNNDAYYAAEAGASSAVEHLKQEVSSYYTQMLSADSAAYSSLHSNFYPGINANAQLSYKEPKFESINTATVFSVSGAEPNHKTFDVTTTSTTADGARYIVKGSVQVTRLDLQSGTWFIDNWAMFVGGQLHLAPGRGMDVTGNVMLSDYLEDNASQWWSRFNHSGGSLIIDPSAGNALSDVLSYPSYKTPSIASPDVYITQNNYNYTAGSTAQISIAGAPGINFSISGSGIADRKSIVYCRGDLTIPSCGNIYADIYCDGNLNLSGAAFYGNIYCRGNVTIKGGSYHSNITCGGNLTTSNFSMTGSAIVGGSINVISGSSIGNMYAAGPITLTQLSSAGVIYSSTSLILGGFSASGIFFSAGDIQIIGSPSISGAVFSMGDVYYAGSSGYMTVNYSQSVINNLLADPSTAFFLKSPGGGSSAVVTADVITGQSINAVGRQ